MRWLPQPGEQGQPLHDCHTGTATADYRYIPVRRKQEIRGRKIRRHTASAASLIRQEQERSELQADAGRDRGHMVVQIA